MRKDEFPEYQALLAPFYYKIGESLVTYIECNMDEMNNLKPLVLPEDPDEVSQHDEEEEKVPESSQNSQPIIEDVIDSGAVKEQSPEKENEPENGEFEDLRDDIFENFGLCE